MHYNSKCCEIYSITENNNIDNINTNIMLPKGAEEEQNYQTQQETATFLTRSVPALVNDAALPDYDGVLPGTSDISDFALRPLEIANLTPSASFDPWDLWLANPAVAAKLRNYYLCRGVMHLRFLVNAQPFWYGRYLVYLKGGTISGGAWNYVYDKYSYYSSDYKAEIDISVNQSVDLTLPYMNPRPYNYVSGVSPSNITIVIDPLFGPTDSQTNTAVAPTIRVYAWVTELKLAVPVAQSGKGTMEIISNNVSRAVPPEQRDGAISGPLTSLAKVAYSFKNVPMIGGAMKLGSNIANIAGGVASIFGFSKPPELVEPKAVLYKTIGNMSVCAGTDTSYKLTIDPKHEKSISPSSVDGTNHDPLSFSNIICRPGLFPAYSIATNTAVGTTLVNFRVTPGIFTVPAADTYQLLPMGLGALAFARWSGSIIFRVSVVCSRYHRGRLGIYWNPQPPVTDVVSNVTNVKFLEITPGAEVEFVVPYAEALPMLQTKLINQSLLGYDSTTSNGFLFIYLDQAITAPSTAPIGLLVTARCGEDFVFAIPTTTTLRNIYSRPYSAAFNAQSPYNYSTTMWSAPTSGVITPPAQPQSGESKLDLQKSSLSRPHQTTTTSITEDVVGEQISSFRTLLKRYNYLNEFFFNQASSTATNFGFRVRRVPVPAADESGGKLFISNPSMFHVFQGCFAFMSGGFRYKIMVDNPANGSNVKILASRGSSGTPATGFPAIITESARIVQYNQNWGVFGAGGTVNNVDSVLEVELPDPSGLRMEYTGPLSSITTVTDCMDVFLSLRPTTIPSSYWNGSARVNVTNDQYYGNMHIKVFVAAADDFSFYTWIGVPYLYCYVPKHVTI